MLLMFYSESENLILKGVSVYDSSHNNDDMYSERNYISRIHLRVTHSIAR